MASLQDRILPARGAAQKASASFAVQLSDSPGRSDAGSHPSPSHPFLEPARKTKSVKYRYSATGKHLSSPLKGSSSSPERRTADKAKGKKRKVSPPSRLSIEGTTPSPLSSVPTTPSVSLPPLPAPKRKHVSKTLSLHNIAHTPSSTRSVFSQPLSPRRKQTKSSTWDIGNSLWVLVNQSGVLADQLAHPQASEPLMWWPAQVVQSQPLRVSLFGDFPSASSSSRGLCTIFAPSPSNVQSINGDSGARRFSRATFRVSSNIDRSPPAKKARQDESASVEDKWESAVQSMVKASTLEKDGLPALLSSYAATGGTFYGSSDDTDPDTSDVRHPVRKPAGSARKKPNLHRSKANYLKQDMAMGLPRIGSPHPPDPTLQIPGELILALAPRTGSSYWPAKILAHVPDRREKYRVKFLDDEEYEITRDKFWTSEQAEFVHCTLGKWESAIQTVDGPDSEDEDEESGAGDSANTQDPAFNLPLPPSPENFDDLTVRAQLAYVKPVLRAILTKEYLPAREKHDAFIKGGSSRVALLKSAGTRGGMDARFVKSVQKAICEWVLGKSGVKPGRLDVGNLEGAAKEEVVALPDTLPTPDNSVKDDKMEGIENTLTSDKDSTSLPISGEQMETANDLRMAVDAHEQQTAPLHSPANGLTLSPASLAPKSQLDLLAEVSQAVATKPSLLPSHPELPKLNISILDIPPEDTSALPSPLTPVTDEDQTAPFERLPVVCEEFQVLSGIEKLDYCLNILLPETIQQLVLWRSGERKYAPLLSAEEEQRLHDVAVRKAAETDWVDDVMRLRAAQSRLRGMDLEKKVDKDTPSRLRRGTISRP